MILSMTGYGAAQTTHDGVNFAVEIRSVNHRYLKLTLKFPEHLQFAESEIESLVRKRISRGSVNLTLRIRSDTAAALRPLNLDVVQGYVNQLTRAKLPAGVQPTLDLAAIALLPGVSDPPELDEEAREQIVRALAALSDQAINALLEMRRDEGRALAKELTHHADEIRRLLSAINERAPYVVSEYHERLRTRVAALLDAAQLDLDRDALAREVAVYAERCDIAEEIGRIGSHLDQFHELCSRGEPVGRTLDFLAQELLREANTIGSKSSDAVISRHVVELKGLIDRLKEQVQNVE